MSTVLRGGVRRGGGRRARRLERVRVSRAGRDPPFDVHAGAAVYRAFLLDGLLEVDLGSAAADEFGPLGDGDFSQRWKRPPTVA
jgi:hypothetical protein